MLTTLFLSTQIQRLYLFYLGLSGIKQVPISTLLWQNLIEYVNSPVGNFIGMCFLKGKGSLFYSMLQANFQSPYILRLKLATSIVWYLPLFIYNKPSPSHVFVFYIKLKEFSYLLRALLKDGILHEPPCRIIVLNFSLRLSIVDFIVLTFCMISFSMHF